jgi:uridine phosphorylase
MDIQKEFPILEFDTTLTALLEPTNLIKAVENIPECAVICFFQDVITQLAQRHTANVIFTLKSELGSMPVYEFNLEGRRLVVFHPGVGAPLAAGMLEEVIALGCRKFIACGGAGCLDSTIDVGKVIIPTAAVRDEGTSYHYLPPSREVLADPEITGIITKHLDVHQVGYILGKTWTTDAFYRETPNKIRLRKSEGCVTVEMETAAFLAVARFRGVKFGQLLYAGDDVGGEVWDGRSWNSHSVRETLFWLSAEICLNL